MGLTKKEEKMVAYFLALLQISKDYSFLLPVLPTTLRLFPYNKCNEKLFSSIPLPFLFAMHTHNLLRIVNARLCFIWFFVPSSSSTYLCVLKFAFAWPFGNLSTHCSFLLYPTHVLKKLVLWLRCNWILWTCVGQGNSCSSRADQATHISHLPSTA